MESADLKPIEEGVKQILDAQGKLVGTVEDLRIKTETLQKAANSTEEWMADVERKLAAKRTSHIYGDNLRALLGEGEQRTIRLAESVSAQNRHAAKYHPQGKEQGILNDDPIAKAAVGLWLRNFIWGQTNPAKYASVADQQAKLTELLSVEKAALGETTTGTGPELVPTIVESEILRLVVDNGVMRPLVRKVPMTTKTHLWPTRASAFSAAVIAEAASITDSAPATPFSQGTMTAKKIGCFATLSMELLQDNVVGVADYLAQEFGEQVARLEDAQSLEGPADAATTYLGVTAAAGVNSVSSGANGDFIFWQLLVDTIFKAGEAASLQGAAFFMHPSAWGSILKGRGGVAAVNDQGGSVLFTASQPLSGRPTMGVLGFPVYTTTAILTNRAAGTGTNRTHIYFGPPSTLLFGDLLGFQIDVNPYGKFQTAQVDIRGIKRTGILVGVGSAWTQYQRVDAAGPMR